MSDKKKSQQLDETNPLPKHIAVIMDGNGRWARQKGLPRIEGHREGMNSVRCIIQESAKKNIAYLTLYAFSTENWRRPRQEVRFLMNLLIEFFKKEINELHKENVRIRMLGQRQNVPARVLKTIDKAIDLTKSNSGLNLNLAFNYGSRAEMVDAINAYMHMQPRPELTEELFSEKLYTEGLPDPDLLIRTSGEMRISNFLLWQLAYAEIVVTPVLWPDFREKEYAKALREYQRRERRFGGIGGKS